MVSLKREEKIHPEQHVAGAAVRHAQKQVLT